MTSLNASPKPLTKERNRNIQEVRADGENAASLQQIPVGRREGKGDFNNTTLFTEKREEGCMET